MKSKKNKFKSTVLFVEKNKKGITVKSYQKTRPGFAIYPTKLQNNIALKKQLAQLKETNLSGLFPINEKQDYLYSCSLAAEDHAFTPIKIVESKGKENLADKSDKFY